jgi:hypothetical protein
MLSAPRTIPPSLKQPMPRSLLYLSFDIEEFDMPLEYGKSISFEDQIAISKVGCYHILDLLKKHAARATFFSTVVFAQNAPDVIARILDEGHELASHGFYHSDFKNEHLLQSRLELERLSGRSIHGFRMARMMPVETAEIIEAGYRYNSSLNPVYIPGRYNNYFKNRTWFRSGTLLEIPASATPVVRFPLFWLSFHNLPQWLYRSFCKITMANDHYLNIYFHPWEFTDLTLSRFGFPGFVKRKTGTKMIEAFDGWLAWCNRSGYAFEVLHEFSRQQDASV